MLKSLKVNLWFCLCEWWIHPKVVMNNIRSFHICLAFLPEVFGVAPEQKTPEPKSPSNCEENQDKEEHKVDSKGKLFSVLVSSAGNLLSLSRPWHLISLLLPFSEKATENETPTKGCFVKLKPLIQSECKQLKIPIFLIQSEASIL